MPLLSALGESAGGHEDVRGIRVELHYSRRIGRYGVIRLEVDTRLGPDVADVEGYEITGALLRKIRVQELARNAVREALSHAGLSPLDILEEVVLRGEETLWTAADRNDLSMCVALVYRVAEISNDNPASAVASFFGLQARTATNWIARARDEGYMSVVYDPTVVAEMVDRVAIAVERAHEVRARRARE